MIRFLLIVVLLLLPGPVLRAEDDTNPHFMLDQKGEPDLDKCGFCHDDDLSLLQPKEDGCVMCHSATQHAGAGEHLRAKPDAVAQLLPRWKDDDKLTFTDAGAIYCGTCHLFHDPKDASEPWLTEPGNGAQTAFASAVRRQLETYRDSVTTKDAAHFDEKGTLALRLSARNGDLCAHCHAQQRFLEQPVKKQPAAGEAP